MNTPLSGRHDEVVAALGHDPFGHHPTVGRARNSSTAHILNSHQPNQGQLSTWCNRTLKASTAEVWTDGWCAFTNTRFCRNCENYAWKNKDTAERAGIAADAWPKVVAGTATFDDVLDVVGYATDTNVEVDAAGHATWAELAKQATSTQTRLLADRDPYMPYRRFIAQHLRWRFSDRLTVGIEPGTDRDANFGHTASRVGAWFANRNEPLAVTDVGRELASGIGIDCDAVEDILDRRVAELAAPAQNWVITQPVKVETLDRFGGFRWHAIGWLDSYSHTIGVVVPATLLDRIEGFNASNVVGPIGDLDDFDDRFALYWELRQSKHGTPDHKRTLWDTAARLH